MNCITSIFQNESFVFWHKSIDSLWQTTFFPARPRSRLRRPQKLHFQFVIVNDDRSFKDCSAAKRLQTVFGYFFLGEMYWDFLRVVQNLHKFDIFGTLMEFYIEHVILLRLNTLNSNIRIGK